jgi:hypothetical protein
MQIDHEQRPFATGSGARPSGLRERIEAAAALREEHDEEPADFGLDGPGTQSHRDPAA